MGSIIESLIFFGWLGGVLLFWGIAFYKLYQQKDGVALFFKHLLGMSLILGVVCSLIIKSTEGCQGPLCGLAELLLAFAIFGVTTFVWPIVLIVITERRKSKYAVEREDILDDFK